QYQIEGEEALARVDTAHRRGGKGSAAARQAPARLHQAEGRREPARHARRDVEREGRGGAVADRVLADVRGDRRLGRARLEGPLGALVGPAGRVLPDELERQRLRLRARHAVDRRLVAAVGLEHERDGGERVPRGMELQRRVDVPASKCAVTSMLLASGSLTATSWKRGGIVRLCSALQLRFPAPSCATKRKKSVVPVGALAMLARALPSKLNCVAVRLA